MGCGKSKHAVATETTVVKSSMSDGAKETKTTKTVTEKGGDSLVHQEVETRSLVVEDTRKETMTTKIEPNAVAKTDNVVPTSEENVAKAAGVVKEDDKVKDLDPKYAIEANTDNVVPTPSKDEVRVTEVVDENEDEDEDEDEEKKESNLIADNNEGKTDNVPPTKVVQTKESNLIKDNNANTEYMTPTLREDAVGPIEVVKDEEVKDFKEEKAEGVISDEKSKKIVDESLIVEEMKDVAPPEKSTPPETKKEEDVEVISAVVANDETSPAKEPKKVPIADKANVAETQVKEA